MKVLTLTSVFSFVGFFIAYFVVASDLKLPFSLLAGIAVIAGYPTGNIAARKIKRTQARIITLAATGVASVALAITYFVLVQGISANTLDIVILGSVLALFFYSVAFLLPVAGVRPNV